MEMKKFRVSFGELSEKEKDWVRDAILSNTAMAALERQKVRRRKGLAPDALMDFVLSSLSRHEIPREKLPQEILPYIEKVNRARRRSLLIDGKGVVRASVEMGRALSEIARPPWKTLPGEVQIIVHAPRPAFNKPLAHLLGRIKNSGFTHVHADGKGNLVFEKKPELAGKIMAPSLKKPKTLFKRARIPF